MNMGRDIGAIVGFFLAMSHYEGQAFDFAMLIGFITIIGLSTALGAGVFSKSQ